MGIFDNLLRRWGYTKTRTVNDLAPWQAHYAQGEQYNIPDPSIYGNQADLYRRLSWIATSVQILAQSCAGVDFEVSSVRGEDIKEIKNHEFEKLLSSPNPLESRFEFLEAWLSYRILTGNGYIWLNRSGENEPPAEMWTLPTNMIIPVPDERMFLKGYLFYPGDGLEIPLEPWEIVHLKRFNPHNKYIGLSPIEAIAQSAQLDMGRVKQESKTYNAENGRLPGILAFADPINNEDWAQMKRDIDDKANKMRAYMMLRNVKAGGVQWIQTAMNAQDAQFIESRTFTKEEIFGIFAPGLASMLAVNATEANSKSGKATFSEYAIWPLLESAGQKLTNDVLPAYGENLRGAFEDVRVKDKAMELQEIATYSQTHTVQEVRQKYYHDEPLGDERDDLFPAQVKAASSAPAMPEQQPGQQPPDQTPPQPPMQEKPVDDTQQEAQPPTDEAPAMSAKAWKELEIWNWKAKKYLKENKPADGEFVVKDIPAKMAGEIRAELAACKSEGAVDELFERYKTGGAKPDPLMQLVFEARMLREALAA